MMNKEIKKQARELYSNKEYNLALTTIFKLDSVEIESFLIKESALNQWFQDFSFCNSIAKDDELLKSLLSLSRIDELMYKHFQCNWQSSKTINPIPFQLKIAELSPVLFVRMLRVSQAFLNNKWYTKVNIDQYSEYIKNHSLVWKHLYHHENKLWSEILNQLDNCINEYNSSTLLINMVIVIELEYFKNHSNLQLHFLSQIYNTFITALLARLPVNHTIVSEPKHFFKEILNSNKAISNIQSLYQSIANWQYFIHNYINTYCYDLKVEPFNENGIISYNSSSKDYYRWQLDGTRYNIIRLDYLATANQSVFKNYDKIVAVQSESPEYECMCQMNYFAIGDFLNDLKLSKFPEGNNLDSSRFYQPIIAASNYYKMIYGLFDQIYQKSNDWFVAYKQLKSDNPNLYEMENFPFIHSSIDELYEINDRQSILVNDYKTKKSILSQPFTYKAFTGKSFNRFNISYDVFKKPFLQIGNKIFTPTLFFANQDWFFSITQNALERLNSNINNKLRKETSVAMELDLKLLFEKAGFKAEIFYGHEFLNSEGDVDIKATDGNDTILIQLKRTKLRLSLKDAYFESVQTDSKASRQINNVEEYFSSENGKIYKWIVTTSFENVYTTINDCLKVNYFDLITILKSFQLIDNISIQFLNERITSDSQIKDVLSYKAILHPENLDPISFQLHKESGLFDILDPYRNQYEIYDEVNLPLPIADPSEYRQVKFQTDEASSYYIRTYNKALAEDKNGNFSKAKSLLEECLDQHPNDFDALHSLAHVLSNMRLYDQAFAYFKKAIFIQPDDLFVCRNYALALMEAGKKEDSLKIYEQIRKKYWFVDLQYFNPIKSFPPEIIEKLLS